MKQLFYFFIIALCLPAFSLAQSMIAGVVVDESDEPLTGATVLLKGSSTGTVTELDGSFRLQANTGDILVFSFLGMESQEVALTNTDFLRVVLMSGATSLEELVVVGYGSQRKSDVTGAIASLRSENFNRGIVSNPGQLLQGKVAGVNVTSSSGEPGANQDIIIRGIGSLRAGTSPLFVVDGFALDNTGNGLATNPLNFINPQDIESIDVLKDASASAIYGARAANGVIVITTKRGKSGQTQVNLSASKGVSTLAREIAIFGAEAFRSQVRAIGGTLDDGGASTDWQDALSRTGQTNNVNVSLSGGTAQSSYFASFGGEEQEGILNDNSLRRYSGRLNLSQRALNDRFKAELNLTASQITNRRADAASVVRSMLQLNPTYTAVSNNTPADDLIGNIVNPFLGPSLYGDFASSNRILANFSPSLEIVKGLTYKLNVGVDYSTATRDVQSIPYLAIADFANGSLFSSNTANSNSLIENTLNYDFSANQSNINLLVGHSYQKIEVENKVFSTSGFPINGVEPRYQAGAASLPTTLGAFANINELQSFFGRINYAYNNRYLLTATMRADGSSKFGDNNKYGYFPSVALGWNLSNEGFLKDAGLFDYLKLRASWGQTGNQEIPSKITKASFTESNTGSNTYPLDPTASELDDYPYGSIFTRLANPDIQWEVSTQSNIGFDFALMKGKLSGTIDYFNKVSENVLLEVSPVDPIQPTNRFWTNIPDMQIINSGVELALSYSQQSQAGFSYTIGGNISFIQNEVKDSPFEILTTGAVLGAGQSGATINGIINGQPIGTFFVQEFIGIGEDGLNLFADRNNDGEILDNDRFAAGTALPTHIFAFNIDLAYKQFDLSFNFNGMGGNKLFNHVALSIFNKGNLSNSLNTTDLAVQFPNEDFSNSNRVSTRYLEDGSFLRLNNATLGYTIPTQKLGWGKFIRDMRVSVTGQNLLLFTKYSGFDPELNTGTSIDAIQSFGIDYFSYPRARTFSLNLNVSF